MDRTRLEDLTPQLLRQFLPAYLASKVDGEATERLEGFTHDWDETTYTGLLDSLLALGDEHRVYPAVPAVRALARDWLPEVLRCEVHGIDHLASAMASGRTIIVTNHMSYVDAVATDVALAGAGHEALADRLIYLAGPKVYQEVFRLMAAASIHSLPVPQSNMLDHTAHMAVRELARRARACLDAGRQALDRGDALCFYPEGSRTRTGRLGSFLRATRRYLQSADVVVPGAIDGTDAVMPLESSRMQPGPVTITFGEPIPLRGRGSAQAALESAHVAISRLLPDSKKPEPGTPAIL